MTHLRNIVTVVTARQRWGLASQTLAYCNRNRISSELQNFKKAVPEVIKRYRQSMLVVLQ